MNKVNWSQAIAEVVLIFIGIAIGIIILGAIATFIVREWRHNNKINGA